MSKNISTSSLRCGARSSCPLLTLSISVYESENISRATKIFRGGNSMFKFIILLSSVCLSSWAYGQSQDTIKIRGDFSQISAGGYHLCAVEKGGEVRCWGSNKFFQISSQPADLAEVSQVSAGSSHSCAVERGGSVRCWGWNQQGQSTPPADLGEVSQISAGYEHSCAVEVGGSVRCWGGNYRGQSTPPSPY